MHSDVAADLSQIRAGRRARGLPRARGDGCGGRDGGDERGGEHAADGKGQDVSAHGELLGAERNGGCGRPQPTPIARTTLHTYVGRLRAALRPHGVTASTPHDGYAVETDGHTVDVREFITLLGRAEHAGDPGEQLHCHDRALALS
ncbi:AfsR/SARP family transcriptional regulator [Streptomyces sp. NPDC054842]